MPVLKLTRYLALDPELHRKRGRATAFSLVVIAGIVVTIGMIRFQDTALIDAMPDTVLNLYTRAIPKRGTGTNAADAIQLALATMSKDAMHRLMLIWDGNQTAGDLDGALAQAASQGVPVDVMPLRYDVQKGRLRRGRSCTNCSLQHVSWPNVIRGNRRTARPERQTAASSQSRQRYASGSARVSA